MAYENVRRHLTSEQIQEFLDERLAPQEAARIREHLSACPGCQVEIQAWRSFFGTLDHLPELSPDPGFSRAVLEQLPVKEPVGARVRAWLGSLVPGTAGEGHLSPEGIQDYVEGDLPRRRVARARTHLAACEPCREETRHWRGLFESLRGLGHLAPSAGFAERVMARVRVPTPVPAESLVTLGNRALDRIRGILPRSRRGWAVAGGVASAPTITMAALVYLVFSHPLLTVGTLFHYLSWKGSALFSSAFSAVAGRLVESVAVFKAYAVLETLAASPLLVGAGGLAFTLFFVLALWVLYRNLFTTPSVDGRYARARI